MPVRVNRQSRLEAILSLIAVPTRLQYSLYTNKVKCMVNYESLRYGSWYKLQRSNVENQGLAVSVILKYQDKDGEWLKYTQNTPHEINSNMELPQE